ncbi:MAG TPA: hypothetical protein VGK84_00525 [Candidatus Tumulicola sp.]|jgi:hypothetical protein
MIRAFSRFHRSLASIVLAACVTMFPAPARATLVADPGVLYQQMKDAYAKDGDSGWSYRAQMYYLSTIFNAGRAYSLQYPTDPAYGELATLTVQIGAGLNYDPLTNHDAAAWWVREAAVWVQHNSKDRALVEQANRMLLRVDSEDAPEELAQMADDDSNANVRAYPGDVDALLARVEANWRAWLLTGNPKWRSLALARAAQSDFPVAHLPTTWGPTFVASANVLSPGVDKASAADVHNAKVFVTRLAAVTPIAVITTVTSMPHDVYMGTLAPADEYFGRLGMSILGIENQLKHINFMLDYDYGSREYGETALVAESIDDMHKVYPRDRDLPMLLLWCYQTLQRMDDWRAKQAASHLKAILTIEYQDSPQAKKLLSGVSSS